VGPSHQSRRISGPLGCHNFRGRTYYRRFLFIFVDWKLISTHFFQFVTINRQQSEDVLRHCEVSCFKKCDTSDGFR
jgi:hypothetical protein